MSGQVAQPLRTPSQKPAKTYPDNSRRWRTEIPNFVFELLRDTPLALNLYIQFKRVCGADGGRCIKSTRTLVADTGMGMGTISAAKKVLVERGLIEIVPGSKKDGTSDTVTCVDVWGRNRAHFEAAAARKRAGGVHPMNEGCSLGEPKKQTPPSSAQPKDKKTTTSTTQGNALSDPPALVVAPSPSADTQKDTLLESDPFISLLLALSEVLQSKEVAKQLVRQFGVEVCTKQLGWLPHRAARNTGAVLAQSIRGDWGEPAAARTIREETQAKIHATAQAALKREQALHRDREREAQEAATAVWFAAQPPAVAAAIQAKATALALAHPAWHTMPEALRQRERERRHREVVIAWKEGKYHV